MSGIDNHKWDIIGKVIITRTLPGSIPDEIWRKYIADIDNHELEYGLSLSWGTLDVSATQRSGVAEAMKKQSVAGVVVTNDRLVRGIVVAVSWFGANIKAFSWANLDQAIGCIKATPDVLERVMEIAVEFHDSVNPPS